MSLRSRLQSKRRSKSTSSAFTNVDLIDFLEENKDIDKLIIYSFDKICTEKNGVAVPSDITFSSEAAYRKEINRIAELYENVPSEENPCSQINISDEINMEIFIPPFISEGIYTVISRKNIQNECGFENSVSSEIYTYLQECIKQKLNIFITGSAEINKTAPMKVLLNLCGDKNKIIISDKSNILQTNKPYCLKINNINSDVNKFEFDNIFANEVSTEELISIFELIISGYNGFIVSMSLKDKTDILEAIRNKILLKSPNLFEENADFMSGSSIDVLLTLGYDNNGNTRITKVSEISDGTNEYTLKDIFLLNAEEQYVSVGNRSRFFNRTNSPELFSENYLKKEYVHSPKSTEPDASPENRDKTAETKEKEEKTLTKLEKLKNKIKQIKKLKAEKINFAEAEKTPQTEQRIEETQADKTALKSHSETVEMNNFKEDYDSENISEESPQNIIFDENPEYENVSSNEGVLASETDNFQDEEQSNVIQPEILNILENNEEEIVEEPELFSEIKDVEINNNDYDFEIQDESI